MVFQEHFDHNRIAAESDDVLESHEVLTVNSKEIEKAKTVQSENVKGVFLESKENLSIFVYFNNIS